MRSGEVKEVRAGEYDGVYEPWKYLIDLGSPGSARSVIDAGQCPQRADFRPGQAACCAACKAFFGNRSVGHTVKLKNFVAEVLEHPAHFAVAPLVNDNT